MPKETIDRVDKTAIIAITTITVVVKAKAKISLRGMEKGMAIMAKAKVEEVTTIPTALPVTC